MQLKPLLVGAQPDRIVAWKYPPAAYSNFYTWSVEYSTNLTQWSTVTNYPTLYTNDVWMTNDWRPGVHAYRMHGRL